MPGEAGHESVVRGEAGREVVRGGAGPGPDRPGLARPDAGAELTYRCRCPAALLPALLPCPANLLPGRHGAARRGAARDWAARHMGCMCAGQPGAARRGPPRRWGCDTARRRQGQERRGGARYGAARPGPARPGGRARGALRNGRVRRGPENDSYGPAQRAGLGPGQPGQNFFLFYSA